MAIDDLTKVELGAQISEGLPAELVVRELRVVVEPENFRVNARLRPSRAEAGDLAGLCRGLVRKVTDAHLWGRYRYRVYQMSGDRVELRVVSQAPGLPDVIPVSMMPGVAGTHAQLTPGSVVLVEFIEGKRSMPIVTAFSGRDGAAHTPQELDLSAATTLRLGGPSASEGVLLGDSFKSWADNHAHGYLGDLGAPLITTPPIQGSEWNGETVVPDLAPSPSAKVRVE